MDSSRRKQVVLVCIALAFMGAWVVSYSQPTVVLPDGDFDDLDAAGTVIFDAAGLLSCNTDIEKLETSASGVISCGSIPALGTDTNANTICAGTTVYLDGEGNCDTLVDTNTNADTICSGTTVYLDGEGNCDTINVASPGSNYSQSFSSQTSISLTHGLGTNNLLVVCYDTSDILLEPSKIDIGASDPWAVAVTFSESISGRCLVNGLNIGDANYSQSFTSQTSVTLTHSLGTSNLIVMCYDADDILVGPSRLDIAASAPWSVVATFSESLTGRCVVNGLNAGRYVESFSSQTTITITGNTHLVGTNMIHVTCYDNSDPRIRMEPGRVTVDDGTLDVVLTFSEAVSGQCTLS